MVKTYWEINIIQGDSICSLCGHEEESANHLIFGCEGTISIWHYILIWLGETPKTHEWQMEQHWILEWVNKKRWRGRILKMGIAEVVHETWLYRNSIVFGDIINRDKIVDKIISCIVYRGWRYRILRVHLAHLMT